MSVTEHTELHVPGQLETKDIRHYSLIKKIFAPVDDEWFMCIFFLKFRIYGVTARLAGLRAIKPKQWAEKR